MRVEMPQSASIDDQYDDDEFEAAPAIHHISQPSVSLGLSRNGSQGTSSNLMARSQKSEIISQIRKEARSDLMLPLIQEENGDIFKPDKINHNNLKQSNTKEIKNDASTKNLKLNKIGNFVEQKELVINSTLVSSRFSPNLNEAASYAAQKVLNRFNSHLPPKKPPSLLTKIAEFAAQKKSNNQRSHLSLEKMMPSLGASINHSRNPSFTSKIGGSDSQSGIELMLTSSNRTKLLKSVKPPLNKDLALLNRQSDSIVIEEKQQQIESPKIQFPEIKIVNFIDTSDPPNQRKQELSKSLDPYPLYKQRDNSGSPKLIHSYITDHHNTILNKSLMKMQQESAQIMHQSMGSHSGAASGSIRDILSKQSFIVQQQLFNDKFMLLPITNSTNQILGQASPLSIKNQNRSSKKEIKFVETKGLVFVNNTASTPMNGSVVSQNYKEKYLEISAESKKVRKINIMPSTKQPVYQVPSNKEQQLTKVKTSTVIINGLNTLRKMARSPQEDAGEGITTEKQRKITKPNFDSKMSLTVNKIHLNEVPHYTEERFVVQPSLQKNHFKNNSELKMSDNNINKKADNKQKSRKDLSLQDLLQKASVQELGQRLLDNQINEQSGRVSLHEWNKETARSSEFEFNNQQSPGTIRQRNIEQIQPQQRQDSPQAELLLIPAEKQFNPESAMDRIRKSTLFPKISLYLKQEMKPTQQGKYTSQQPSEYHLGFRR